MTSMRVLVVAFFVVIHAEKYVIGSFSRILWYL